MKSGATFWLQNRNVEGGHPHFVLSDTTANAVLVVVANLTEWQARKDQACILEPGEDQIVKKRSIVSFMDAKIVANAYLDEQLAAGEIIAGPPLSQATLHKIRAACAVTRHIPNDVFDLLDAQGLVPLV